MSEDSEYCFHTDQWQNDATLVFKRTMHLGTAVLITPVTQTNHFDIWEFHSPSQPRTIRAITGIMVAVVNSVQFTFRCNSIMQTHFVRVEDTICISASVGSFKKMCVLIWGGEGKSREQKTKTNEQKMGRQGGERRAISRD